MKFIILFFISISVIASNNKIKPHIIEYSLIKSGINIGTEKRTLSVDDGIYTYISEAKTTGFAKLIADYQVESLSEFGLAAQFKSINFKYKEKKGGNIKKDVNIMFDDDFLAKNNIDSSEKLVDNLAIFLIIGYDIKNNNSLDYLVAKDNDNIKDYNFVIQSEESLELLDKNFAVVKITDNKDLVAYFAKEYDYLPILIRKKNMEYKLKSISLK